MGKLPDGVTNTMIPGTYMVADGRGCFWRIRRNPTLGKDRAWRARPAPNGPLGAAPVDGRTLSDVCQKLAARIHTPPVEPF